MTIPFLDTEIPIKPLILWQSISTVIAFSVVIFTIQEKKFAWILNIFKKVVNFFIYFQKGLFAKLILDYILMIKSAYAFSTWDRKPKKKRDAQHISALRPKELLLFCFLVIVGWLCFGYILAYAYSKWPSLEGKKPYKDSFHAACSIVNYYLLAHKKREAWLFSLAGQIVYVTLFIKWKEPFAVKYLGYIFLSIRGFYKWHQAYKKHEALGHAASS